MIEPAPVRIEARRRTRGRRWPGMGVRTRFYGGLLLLLLPTLAGMAVFTYYPQFAAVKYSFYRWDGQAIEEFRGLQNFVDAFRNDPLFWHTFQLVGILLAANLVKMWPSIFTAIAIHRLRNERWQYAYRVLFVIPMIIPALVWLLIWKSFYDPTVGILNTFLNATGLMGVLQWMDTAMPGLAARLQPLRGAVADVPFGSVWGLGLFGVTVLGLAAGWRAVRQGWAWWAILLVAGWFVWGPARQAALLAVATAAVAVLGRDFAGRDLLRWAGIAFIGVASALVLTTMIWTEPTHAFVGNTPAWLGHTKLIIPSVIFWGFPWVGTVGVLIYLAGLQNISQDVYEAADLDGVSAVGKLFRIELPLIMTQVRINLIFLTIGTLTDYGLFLLLLGPDGGPGNKGMVPGLYMYREAFISSRFGYACALGMVLFVIVLGITILYQRYVKVEK
jgi:ABC-type sugar transport system permease subunit